MNDYVYNQLAVIRWMRLLDLILFLQRRGKHDVILKDREFSRMIEIIEEYDDILFKENL